MDQSFYGSNIVLNSMETPTLADCLISSNDTNIDYPNMSPRETDDLNIWNSHDPNSSACKTNLENHDATKMDDGWNTSLSINFVGGPSMEGRHCERNNILSLEHVDLNLNNSPADDGQAFTQMLNSNHVNQRTEHNVHTGPHSQIMEVSSYPFLPEFLEPEHAPYSTSNGSYSSGFGQVLEDVGTAINSIDVQRIACKRKNMEGVIGESSSSCNISAELGMPSLSRYLPAASFSEVNQCPGFSAKHRGNCSEWNLISGSSGNAETSQRNSRARLNPACQHDGSPLQSHSGLSSIWSSADPSSILNPFNQSADQNQPHVLVPGFPENINNYSSTSSIGSSSLPAYTLRRLIASPEEANIRRLPRNDIVDQPAFLTRTTINHLGQDPPNWNPSNSSLSVAGNRASSSLGVIPSPGSMRTPSEMIPAQNSRNFSEEPGQSLRTIRQGYSPLYPRAAVSIDRQRDGVSDLALSARSRDGRSRMMSEIRNALDLMRRGMNIRFEDIFIFDRSGFYGRADLYDRHRDMRLDVDSMSYEELLALEERIGCVNTGLNEETILKSLRQKKYTPCNLEVASNEQEPCCICREDYSEGEGIGFLDCKHDFHAVCIKQWLMIKNLCPICKTTGLVS